MSANSTPTTAALACKFFPSCGKVIAAALYNGEMAAACRPPHRVAQSSWLRVQRVSQVLGLTVVSRQVLRSSLRCQP
jgi:hypothetical protein